jgi:2,4-dienoyl-CoA reductase-like NADH-dependent reductase (Old Yellow Enzyme family)
MTGDAGHVMTPARTLDMRCMDDRKSGRTDMLEASLTLPCGQKLLNRLAKSATQEGLADARSLPSGSLETLYRRWSHGGAGLLISGDVMVDRQHMERPGNVVIDGRAGLDALKAWAAAGTSNGNHFWMQINHPGRQSPLLFNPHPLAPSASVEGLPPRAFGLPRAMTELEIHDVVDRFARTAAVAREAGFTGIQLHAAHGFLISQFLSPLANFRNDNWGGSIENRARLLLEAIGAIRAAVGPDFPISIKLNSADFQRGGFDIEGCLAVVGMLAASSVDLLEISGGNIASLAMMGLASTADTARADGREAYFADYARQIRPIARMPIMITGGFRSVSHMNTALSSGLTDVIGLARPMCVDPEMCLKLLDGSSSCAPTIQEELALDRARHPDGLDVRRFASANSAAQLSWLYLQLARLGSGQDADLTLPIESAVQNLERLDADREDARARYEATSPHPEARRRAG